MLLKILGQYGFAETGLVIKAFGTGLINHTWSVTVDEKKFILQRVNHQIFKDPEAIAANSRMIGDFISQHFPDYLFVKAVQTTNGKDLVYEPGEGYFRLFPFVEGSHTIDVADNPGQAFEAARQFGKFTHLLSAFPSSRLNLTLPDFHNLPLRYQQFESALKAGNRQRISDSKESISFLQQQQDILNISRQIPENPAFKRRVTHHDTKISNVLFGNQDQGLCVIDLDTVMSGYFISDVGDMLRTYLSPVSEEEQDFSKIQIRDDYFEAIAKGYLSEMKTELTAAEKDHFVYAGKFLIFMQALRFLTDYINNDSYYGSKYEGHNLVRANNQIVLLQQLTAKERDLMKFFS